MDRMEVIEHEKARLHARDEYQQDKQRAALNNAAVTIFLVGIAVLAILLFVAAVVLSPGILMAMILVGSVGWVTAWFTGVVGSGLVFGGLYALTHNLRKAGIFYAATCLVAAITISALGRFSDAGDFLRGQYEGVTIFTSAWRALPRFSSSSSDTATVRDQQAPPQHGTQPSQAPPTTPPTQADSSATTVASTSSPPAASQAQAEIPVPQISKTEASPAIAERPLISQSLPSKPEAQPPTLTAKIDELTSPSFDCAKASTTAEKRICANPELAALDRDLSQLYLAVRNPANEMGLRLDQLAWMKARAGCLSDFCLKGVYETRIEHLRRYQQ
jgi:hypothetical protein